MRSTITGEVYEKGQSMVLDTGTSVVFDKIIYPDSIEETEEQWRAFFIARLFLWVSSNYFHGLITIRKRFTVIQSYADPTENEILYGAGAGYGTLDY